MAILNALVRATPTVIARVSTLESVGMSLSESREHFKKLRADARHQAGSDDMYKAQLGRELLDEYDTCIEYIDECLVIRKKEEISKMNAMQYAAEFNALTVGELMHMLEELQSRWTDEDTEFLGELKNMPVCVGNGKGITKSNFKLIPEHGLVAFESPRIAQ